MMHSEIEQIFEELEADVVGKGEKAARLQIRDEFFGKFENRDEAVERLLAEVA